MPYIILNVNISRLLLLLLMLLLFLLLDLVISLKLHIKCTLCSHSAHLRATRSNRRKRMCLCCTVVQYSYIKYNNKYIVELFEIYTETSNVHSKRGACISFIPINRSMHFFPFDQPKFNVHTLRYSAFTNRNISRLPLHRMDFLLKLEYIEFYSIFCSVLPGFFFRRLIPTRDSKMTHFSRHFFVPIFTIFFFRNLCQFFLIFRMQSYVMENVWQSKYLNS